MSRPFIPVPGVFKVQLIYSYQSQRIENVLHVLSGGGVLTADADRIEGVFASWWTNTARSLCATNCSLVLIVLDALNAANGLHKEYTSGWTAAGTSGGSGLPGNVTSSVKLASGLRGRSYRGRIYWPAITTNMAAGGQLTGVTQVALAAAVNTLRTSLTSDGSSDKLVVVSYMENGVWRPTGLATEITSCSAHLNLDSQRRRLPGRGL